MHFYHFNFYNYDVTQVRWGGQSFEFTESMEKINLMCMDEIKIFAKNEKDDNDIQHG